MRSCLPLLFCACASVPPAEGTAVADSVPAPPWTLVYADGAGNLHRWSQADGMSSVTFVYDPVTPEQSSTGMYSGGPPREERLVSGDPRVRALWAGARALQADTARHWPSRDKGTGAFTLITSAGTAEFIVEQGDALAAWADLAAPFGVVVGVAHDAKGGAIVRDDEGRAFYLEHIDSWPPEVHGKRVKVSGKITTKQHLPEALNGAGGERSAGASGSQSVIEAPSWVPATD
jgi:hypothetical protein